MFSENEQEHSIIQYLIEVNNLRPENDSANTATDPAKTEYQQHRLSQKSIDESGFGPNLIA